LSVRQQINLYQPIFSEERRGFSARAFAVVLALTIAVLAGYSIHTSLRLRDLAAKVEELRSSQAQQQEALDAATAPQTAETPDTVQARVKQLTATLTQRQRALQVLESGAAGQTSGFAARMEALARRHVDGLWIDRMTLSGTTGAMTLSGATLQANIVPDYLASLARENVLSGTRFDDFVIERPAPAGRDADQEAVSVAVPKHVRFRAGSRALAPHSVEDVK
jgi:hypothetical protein